MSRNGKGSGVSGCLSLFILVGLISVVVSTIQGLLDSAATFISKVPGYIDSFFSAMSVLIADAVQSGLIVYFIAPIILYVIFFFVIKRWHSKKHAARESLIIDTDEYDGRVDYQLVNTSPSEHIHIPYLHMFGCLVIDNDSANYTNEAEMRARDYLYMANSKYSSALKTTDFSRFFRYYEEALFFLSQAAYIEQKSPSQFTHIQGSIKECYENLQNGMSSRIKLALNRQYEAITSGETTASKLSVSDNLNLYKTLKMCVEDNRSKFDEDSLSFANHILTVLAKKSGIHHNSFASQTLLSSNLDFDSLSGIEFEEFCKKLLYANGFQNIEGTKTSGDQGVDIIADKDNLRYAIQCKCYSSNLGNTPIQEVCAGRVYYNCQIGVVMTNRYFTKSAYELAKATGILLWDRNKIVEMSSVLD